MFWWGTTPAQFEALLKRKEAADEAAFLRAGIIASTIANVNRGKRKKAFKPQDFMPKQQKRKKTWQEQMNYMKTLTALMGDKRGNR